MAFLQDWLMALPVVILGIPFILNDFGYSLYTTLSESFSLKSSVFVGKPF